MDRRFAVKASLEDQMDSTLYEAVDQILTERAGYPLKDWLLDQIEQGHSLRRIRDDLHALTGIRIRSQTTVANWRDELIGTEGDAA